MAQLLKRQKKTLLKKKLSLEQYKIIRKEVQTLLIIMVDVDCVLNNLQDAVIKVFNERYGTSYTINDFPHFNVSECLNKNDALNFDALYTENGIYNHVSPLSGAQNALGKLKKQGHDIYIVTDAAPNMFEEKVAWMKFYFPMVDESHIISMKHKWLFKCDVMIDDNLDNLLGGYHYERICFDWPWNRVIRDEVYGIHRAKNWNDVLNTVNKINQKWSDVAV